MKPSIILKILHRLQCKLQVNYLISNNRNGNWIHLLDTKSDLYLDFLQIIYNRFILYYENKSKILHWNRGKIQRIPNNFTSFNYQMPGWLDKRIHQNVMNAVFFKLRFISHLRPIALHSVCPSVCPSGLLVVYGL